MLDADSGSRLKTMALTDAGPFIMAVGNDYGYDQIFERQLMVHASPGDALLSITGSGNSAEHRHPKHHEAQRLVSPGKAGYP